MIEVRNMESLPRNLSKTTVPGRFRPPTRILDRGYAEPIRCAMPPTRYSWVNSPPSASWIDTLGAPNSRAVVSAICCNGRATSPDALATARRISALTCLCIRAALSCLFRLALSGGREGFPLRGPGLAGFSLRNLAMRVLSTLDLRARSPLRPAAVARFPAFFVVLAICRAPGQSTPHPSAGANASKAEGADVREWDGPAVLRPKPLRE